MKELSRNVFCPIFEAYSRRIGSCGAATKIKTQRWRYGAAEEDMKHILLCSTIIDVCLGACVWF
jgi:hypothetical protein